MHCHAGHGITRVIQRVKVAGYYYLCDAFIVAEISTQTIVTRAIRVELARRSQSQRWLAQRIAKRPAWLSSRMNGRPPFKTTELDLIATALGIDADVLWREERAA